MVKPGTAAAAAVPLSLTTPRSASPISFAVSDETTWRSMIGENELIVLPSAVVIDFTMRGMISLPPLAIVAIAKVICNGVTPTSCPIGIGVVEFLYQDLGCRL